jgi:hypothetical protein
MHHCVIKLRDHYDDLGNGVGIYDFRPERKPIHKGLARPINLRARHRRREFDRDTHEKLVVDAIPELVALRDFPAERREFGRHCGDDTRLVST